MAIVFVNRYFHPDQSATSRMISSLAFALAKQGHTIKAVTGRHYHDRRATPLPARETIEGVQVIRVPTSAFGRAGTLGRAADYATFHLSVAAWLLGHVAKEDICVFCTDPPLISVSGTAAVKLRRGRVVNWVMDLFPEVAMELGMMPANGFAARSVLALRDWSYRNSALTVCPIDAMAHHLETGAHAAATAVVRHWADDDELRPVARDANPLAREWGLRDTFVVGYSGNFGRAHEFATLIDAARRLDGDPGIRFLLVGAGHRRAFVEDEVMRLGLTNVIFRPFQPKELLPESLSLPDVHLVSLLPRLEHCIVPSKFYGILAVGRPAIFIGDGAGEIATNLVAGDCGLSVMPGDGAGLAAAITHLRDHPARTAQMGANARHLLDTTYTRARGVGEWSATIAPLMPSRNWRSRSVRPREAIQ